MTWIVYRKVKDKRCSDGVFWQPIGWVNQVNEELARREAHKMFARYDEETFQLVETKQGCGFLR